MKRTEEILSRVWHGRTPVIEVEVLIRVTGRRHDRIVRHVW